MKGRDIWFLSMMACSYLCSVNMAFGGIPIIIFSAMFIVLGFMTPLAIHSQDKKRGHQ